MTARVYDTVTGEIIDDNDYARVTEKAASGEYRFTAKLPDGSPGPDVPAISLEDGKTYWLPPDRAGQAFADGAFRYASPEDMQAEQDKDLVKQTKAIKEKNFGDVGGQLVTGAEGMLAGATGGLSRTMLTEEQERAVNMAREVNPVAATIGEVAGTLAPTGLGGLAAKLGTKVAAGATSAIAQGIVGRVAAKGLGASAEGLALGLGQGISEAALGDPSEIAEHVMAGAGWGTVLGGVLGTGGALLSEAAPLIKSAGKGLSEATSGVRESVAARILANSSERAAFKEGMAIPAAQRAEIIAKGGSAAEIKAATRAAEVEQAALAKAAKTQYDDVMNAAKGETDEVKHLIKVGTKDAESIYQVQRDMLSTAKAMEDELDTVIAQFADIPAQLPGTIQKSVNDAVKALEATGDSAAKAVAKDFREVLEARLPEGKADISLMDELSAARAIRSKAGSIAFDSAADKTVKTPIMTMWNDLRTTLRTHPEKDIADMLVNADDHYRAAYVLGKYFKVGESSGVVKGSLKNLMLPTTQTVIEKVSANAPEFAGVLAQYAQAGSNLAKQTAALEQATYLLKKFSTTTEANRLNPSAVRDVFDMIGAGKNTMDLLDNYTKTKALVEKIADMTPADKLIALRQAAGKPVEKDLLQLSKDWANKDKMAQIKARHSGEGAGGGVKDRLARAAAGAGIGSMAGSVIGEGDTSRIIGGAGAGAMIGLAGVRGDAYAGLKALTAIQTAAAKGAEKIARATEAAIKSVTTGKVSKIIISQGAKKEATLDDKKKDYAKQRKLLTDNADPETLSNNLTEKFAYLEGAPNIKVAMGAQIHNTVAFLNSKLPQDRSAVDPLFQRKGPGVLPSDAEISKFHRYVRAAENPASILSSLAAGRVSKEEVETVRTLHPILYEKIQTGIMEAIASGNAKKMTYEHRLALGVMFGIATDASLEPTMLTRLQSNFLEKDAGGRPEGAQDGAPRAVKADFSKTTSMAATDLQQTLARRSKT